jgi:hypothetical protein
VYNLNYTLGVQNSTELGVSKEKRLNAAALGDQNMNLVKTAAKPANRFGP